MTDIDFGSPALTLGGAPARSTGTLTVSCTHRGNAEMQVCLDFGAGSGGAPTSGLRVLSGPPGAPPLPYALRSEGFAGPDIDTADFAVQMSGGSGAASLTVFAELVPGAALPPAGSYSATFPDALMRFGRGQCRDRTATGIGAFTVRAELTSACTVTTGALDFGILSDLDAAADATAGVFVTCTPGAAFSIGMGPGMGPGVTSPAARRMTRGADTLTYGIYLDPARSLPWGNAPGLEGRATGVGTGAAQGFTAFGRVPAGQAPAVGDYADTVVVTIEY